MLRYAVGLVALLVVFSSCKTDIDLIGEYQEKAVVFGMLDPLDNPNMSGKGHLFRIQKAFLGEESAFVMALSPDSSYFKYEDLFVELIEYDGANETNRWVLDTVIIANKDTGDPNDDEIDFFGPYQRLYSTADNKIIEASNSNSVNIDVDREYVISLKKRPAGVANMTIANMDTVAPIADARTEIVDASTLQFTAPNANAANFQSQKLTLVNTSGEAVPYVIKFQTATRVSQYEVWLRFHYREVRDNVETPKSITWRVATVDASSALSLVQTQITAQEVFSRIAAEVPVEEGVIRKIGKADGAADDPFPPDGRTQDLDIIIYMAGEDLFQYIDINNPSNTGVLQDKPVYTNINNGIGVFSSRTKAGLYNRIYLSGATAQQLVSGEYNAGRGFVIDPN